MLVKILTRQLAELCISENYRFEDAYESVVERDASQDILTMDTNHKKFPHRLLEVARRRQQGKPSTTAEIVRSFGEGPGTELKIILQRYLGITTNHACTCNKRAKEMNEKGVDWCEANKSRIVGWLSEEAEKRNLPFMRSVASSLVSLAIWRHRRKTGKRNERLS